MTARRIGKSRRGAFALSAGRERQSPGAARRALLNRSATMKAMLSIAFATALAAGAASAQAPSPFVAQKTLSAAAAETIGKTCIAFAQARNLKMSVVVLNSAGAVIYVWKMDGANDISLDTAERKAKTAWMFRRPTSQMAEQIKNGGANTASWMGYFPVLGGLPILVDGGIAGAVGVGGGPPPNDEQCGQAGIDAVIPRAPAPPR